MAGWAEETVGLAATEVMEGLEEAESSPKEARATAGVGWGSAAGLGLGSAMEAGWAAEAGSAAAVNSLRAARAAVEGVVAAVG